MILDGTNKRLYSIDPETKESRKVFEGFDESALPQFLECGTVFCYVGDSAKFYLLDPEKPEKVDDYMYGIDGIQDIYPYGDFLYLLAKDKIYTYKIGGTDPEAIEWLSSGQTIENARSIFINSGVIYVITDSEIVKFSNKRRDVIFKLDYSKVSNPISLGAANGWLYVLDVSDNVKALQVFHSNTGEFVKTIELARENEHPKFFTSPRYTNGKLLFEKSEVLYEVTL
jgi:hypothetical protein